MEKTLVEMLQFSSLEIADRLKILNLSAEELSLLTEYRPMIEACAETIVEEFYETQTTHTEVASIIGDAETMRRLRNALRRYVVELFCGEYDHEYVNNRLRIGLVHKRIGVEPKFYLAGTLTLKSLITEVLESHETDEEKLQEVEAALEKLLQFDTTLIFDTYIHSVVTEVENAKQRAITYANELEEKNRLLNTYAHRDPLTDVLNTSGMQTVLRREVSMAQRRDSQLSVIYIDIDNFKQINDKKGHTRGDEVLVGLAKCISENIREVDFVCRVSGDEFCVILPDCDEDGATTTVERIQETFEMEFPDCTFSSGISASSQYEYYDENRLVRDADERMYEDKLNKKNGKKPIQQFAAG